MSVDLGVDSVHGEYRVSPLDMPPIAAEDGRLSGEDIHNYVHAFATRYLKGKIQYETEVCDIRRHPSGTGWRVEVRDVKTGTREERTYARVVLCTGVRSLSPCRAVRRLTGRRAAAQLISPPD